MLHPIPPRESPFSQGSSSSTECHLPRMHSSIHRMHKHKLAQLIIVSIRVITFIIELGYRAPRELHSLIIFYLTQLLLDKHKFTNSKKKKKGVRKQTWKGSLRPIKAELNNLVKIHQRSDQIFSHKERLLEAIEDPKVSQEFC